MTKQTLSPSAFMRQLRPENYSDSEQRTAYELDQAVLDHHLETITSRNQTHDFEIFCRKLCERSICPNLRPQTGPDGGGDSKADSETLPVADEIATRTYVGEAAGNDPAYTALIEQAAAFVSERTGTAEGALMLLRRAGKLDFEEHFEMIRLLGKAARGLVKQEYRSEERDGHVAHTEDAGDF